MVRSAMPMGLLQVNPPVFAESGKRATPHPGQAWRTVCGLILSRARLAKRHRPRVHAAFTVVVKRPPEYGLAFSCGDRKQGHGRAELQVVRRAEDGVT